MGAQRVAGRSKGGALVLRTEDLEVRIQQVGQALFERSHADVPTALRDLQQFCEPRSISENTTRHGFTPDEQ